MIKQINKLNGWQRLFVLIAIIYGIVAILSWYAIVTDAVSSAEEDIIYFILRHIWYSFLFWSIPLVFLYSLGSAIAWVRRGFRQQHKDSR
jgi:hypothetical protein